MKTPSQNNNIGSVQTSLKHYRDSLGKETKRHHYANEIRLIRFAITGSCKSDLDINNPSREQLPALRDVIRLNRQLIESHIDYKLRKQICRELVLHHKFFEMEGASNA